LEQAQKQRCKHKFFWERSFSHGMEVVTIWAQNNVALGSLAYIQPAMSAAGG
jgi:hypothetical protein